MIYYLFGVVFTTIWYVYLEYVLSGSKNTMFGRSSRCDLFFGFLFILIAWPAIAFALLIIHGVVVADWLMEYSGRM